MSRVFLFFSFLFFPFFFFFLSFFALLWGCFCLFVFLLLFFLRQLGNEDLLTSVKRRKLKWYGHVIRSTGLANTILQGIVQGGRRRGRHRKRCEDSIREWTGLEWNITLQKAENHEEWRKLVVKYTVVTQRSARLRDI